MKIDMHCHTKYSKDALASPSEIFKKLKKKGLDGFAITDHDNTNGWEDALLAAKENNMFLILGEEIKSKNGDILGLFLNKEIKMKGEEPEKIIEEIHNQNGIAIIPHPFDLKKPFKDIEKYIDLVDGIEIFNARRFVSKENSRALDLSLKHPNLAITAGSDAHALGGVGFAYIESSAKTTEEFKKDILLKNVKWQGLKAPLIYLLAPTLRKIKNALKLHSFFK